MGELRGKQRAEPALIVRLAATGAVLGAALLLKAIYRGAGSGDLAWIIAPTARAVELVSPLRFSYEAGYGWIDAGHGVVIAPACAGVNFLVICFAMTACQVVWKSGSRQVLGAGLAGVAAGSFAVAVGANAARILFSEFLSGFDTQQFGVSAAAVHRLAGICIYYPALCICHQVLARFLSDSGPGAHDPGGVRQMAVRQVIPLIPLGWYLAVSLGVPIATRASERAPDLFRTHAVTILGATAALTVLLRLAAAGLGRGRLPAVFPLLLERFLDLFGGVIEGLAGVFHQIFRRFAGILGNIVDLLAGLFHRSFLFTAGQGQSRHEGE